MLRVRSSSLIADQAGRLCFREVPFTGLACEVSEEGVVVAIHVVEDGAVTGPSDDWLEPPEGGTRVDGSALEIAEDYGPELFQGAPLTGIAYFFDESGVCVAEVEHVDGHATELSERAWYEGGEPKELVGDGEYTSWLRDGKLERRATGGVVVYNLIVRDDGRIEGLVLRDASLFDLEAVRALTLSDDLVLKGSAIDTDLLRTLRDHAGLGEVRRLRLSETGVGPEAIDVLASLEHLTALHLRDNPKLGPEEAREIEARLPGCKVRLETGP